ncbi:ATP-NAD kinase-like domain-containing protein, partial [Paraphysoderma sedebokerense]
MDLTTSTPLSSSPLYLVSNNGSRTPVSLYLNPSNLIVKNTVSGYTLASIPLTHILTTQYTSSNLHPPKLPCALLFKHVANEVTKIKRKNKFFTIFWFRYAIHRHQKPRFVCYTFYAGTETEAETLVGKVRMGCGNANNESRNFLVLVNPNSGKRKARKIWTNIVRPLFDIAGVTYNMQETTTVGAGISIAQSLDTQNYHACVVVSGDGLLNEVLHGLLTRPDWESAKDFPLAVIPAGSGNGFARTIDCGWPEIAALNVVNYNIRPIDVFSVSQMTTSPNGGTAPKLIRYGLLSISWAFIADVDLGSEVLRFLGPLRNDVWSVVCTFNLKSYRGRIAYLPADGDESLSGDLHGSRGEVNSTGGGLTANGGTESNGHHTKSNHSHVLSIQSQSDSSSSTPIYGPKARFLSSAPFPLSKISGSTPAPPNWTVLPPDTYQYFLACNTSFISLDFKGAPHARMNDGYLDLIFNSDLTTSRILPYLLDTTSGKYVEARGMEYVKIKAFVLDVEVQQNAIGVSNSVKEETNGGAEGNIGSGEQLALQPVKAGVQEKERLKLEKKWKKGQSKGYISLDGERMEYRGIYVEMHPGMGRVIVPRWLDENEYGKGVGGKGKNGKIHRR